MCGLHVGSGCGGEDRPTEPKLSRMILCGVASSVRSAGFAVRRCEFPSPGRARGGVGCGCAVMGSGNGLRRKRRNGRFLFSASRSCWAGKPSTLPCEEVLPGGSFGGAAVRSPFRRRCSRTSAPFRTLLRGAQTEKGGIAAPSSVRRVAVSRPVFRVANPSRTV